LRDTANLHYTLTRIISVSFDILKFYIETVSKGIALRNIHGKDNLQTFPVPFVWDNQTVKIKRIVLEIDGKTKEYEIDEIKQKDTFKVGKKSYFISLVSTGYYRELEIRHSKVADIEEEEESNVGVAAMKSITKFAHTKSEGMNATIQLEGIGISIVDEEPKEIIYLSIYKIEISAIQELKMVDFSNQIYENQEEYNLNISHMQIDNMVSVDNPTIFAPEDGDRDKILNDPEYTPFIQIKMSQTSNMHVNSVQKRIDAFQVKLQKMKIEADTGSLAIIVKNVTKIMEVFSEDKIKDPNKLERGPTKLTVKSASTPRSAPLNSQNGKGSMNIVSKVTEKDIVAGKPKEEVCEELVAKTPDTPDLKSIKTDRLYFRMIHLSPIKITLTFRFEKKALNFDFSRGFGALTVVYTLATSIANISDAPLSYKELMIENVFTTQEELTDIILKNIIKQSIFQFYKLIGSSDIIGNPVGFVSKLGSGVYEFFSEPTKGAIKGPRQFVGGVGKGVTSLATGIVSAGFDSTSKITGSVYSILKSISGQEFKYQRKPNNVCEGIYRGILGGTSEVYEGVTGIVTKPYQGARSKGVFGCCKGVGKGICGVIVAPFTSCLRCCSTFSQGVNQTAIMIKKGRQATFGRFRFPRYINPRNVLEPYDDGYARACHILMTIKQGKYGKENLLFFQDFTIYNKFKRTNRSGTLILTEKSVLF
jgi:hypothetical protein